MFLNTICKYLKFVSAICILNPMKLHHCLLFTYTGGQKSSLAKYTIYHLVKNAYTT